MWKMPEGSGRIEDQQLISLARAFISSCAIYMPHFKMNGAYIIIPFFFSWFLKTLTFQGSFPTKAIAYMSV